MRNKYHRSSKNYYLGGVCGGLENSTGIDAIIWRLIFVFAPSSIIVYAVMWIFTEKDQSFEDIR